MGFIVYQEKNGRTYATFCKAKRENGAKTNETVNLGLVLDKEKGVFKSRERGVYAFSVENGYGEPSEEYELKARSARRKEVDMLDYGDTFFLDSFLRTTPYYDIIKSVVAGKEDLVLSILYYYILQGGAREYSRIWWEGNYASCLFPKALPYGSKISALYRKLGEPDVQAAFFRRYILAVLSNPGIHGLLIDSSGIPNSIDMDKTEISNHNGDINVEARIIFVCERNTGLPLYFRTISGNIIDLSTVAITISDLEKAGICIDFAILDAGYYDENTIKTLQDKDIAFITRMKRNRKLYKETARKHLTSLADASNMVTYNGRALFMKKVEITLNGKRAYAYLGKDLMMAGMEAKSILPAALENGTDGAKLNELYQDLGVFMLISSEDLDTSEVLPLYYTRQQVEQVFDIAKNYAELMQLGQHTEGTFEGHCFMSFLATIVCHLLQRKLKGADMNQIELLRLLRNHKCAVYDNGDIVPREAKKKQKDAYAIIGAKPYNWRMDTASICG